MKRPLVPFVSLLAASQPLGCSASSFASSSTSTTSTPAPCPLHCENGGVCRHGSADASTLHPVHSMYTPVDAPFLDSSHAADHSRAHCVCPAGYVGPTCTVKLETCRGAEISLNKDGVRDHYCLHGAPCRVGVSDTGEEFYYCECSEAGERAREGGGDRSGGRNFFAGHMCQHASTTPCGGENGTKDARNAEEGGNDGGDRDRRRRGATIGSFCTNWGTCREGGGGEEHPGCDCPDEWEGPHCEYRKGTDQWAQVSSRQVPTSQNRTADAPSSSTATAVEEGEGEEEAAEEETPEQSRRRRSGLVFVAVAAAFSIIGMAFPQLVKWWRKRNEGLDGGSPAAEVTFGAENMDPDGASLSMSSMSVSEVDTVTVAGDASVVPPPPPPTSDVLV